MESADAVPKQQNAVLKALKAPYKGVSGIFQRRAAKLEEQRSKKHATQLSVELHDFSGSSHHRKTNSDSSIYTADESQDVL